MSVVTSSMRNTHGLTSTSPHIKPNHIQAQQTNEYNVSKKSKKETTSASPVKSVANTDTTTSTGNSSNSGNSGNSSQQNGSVISNPNLITSSSHPSINQSHAEMDYTQSITTSLTSTINGAYNYNGLNHMGLNGISNSYSHQYPTNSAHSQWNGLQGSTVDPTGPLPNEIFELLNEFWRPNDLNSLDTQGLNGKMFRRSPNGSLEDAQEDEKDGEDDLTSIADTDIPADRNTQKRRYSRLSDGYERLKCVLPSVKDKRRVSKARILDEAINYIQRLESITNVLKREHEKRLSMLNGSNGFFSDYSMQPYMRSVFQKQIYPNGMSASKMNQYPKMSTTPTGIPKSPRLKQFNQQYSSPTMGVGANMSVTDYNYNNINNTYSGTSSMYPAGETSQMINGDTSPIANNSPYSACSLSPGSTPTTYQNNSVVNNSWPYQGGGIGGYNEASNNNQLSSFNQNRQSSNSNGSYTTSNYTNLNGSMWGSMGLNEANSSTQMTQHTTDHAMKVG